MSLGLALGKFAPLHRGHQLVLDAASRNTRNQVFVIYDSPSVTDIPLPVRANWLRTLYPHSEVLEAWGAPEEVGLNPLVMEAHEEFLVALLGPRRVTHFFNSESYGGHISKRLGAENVQVDPSRDEVPISSTILRSKPSLVPIYTHPMVVDDLTTKVVFLGAPSTGKSTMAVAAAERFGTIQMPEFGREYWELHAKNRRLEMQQLEEIATTHLAREAELMPKAGGLLFVDTDASTTAIFADYYHGRRSKKLDCLSSKARDRYDLTFLCLNDFEYADTEDRSGEANQIEFQRRIEEELRSQRRPYIPLGGSVLDRLETVQSVLKKHKPFSNPVKWTSHG